MSITAVLTNHIVYSGDQESEQIFSSGELEDSVYMQELVTLAIGDNTIPVPWDNENFTVHGVAIIPPTANTNELGLKGTVADLGLQLSANRVSIIQFGATPPASFVLSIAVEEAVVRLVWF